MGNLQKDMTIESLQHLIREFFKEFELYGEEMEDLVNLLSERLFKELQEE